MGETSTLLPATGLCSHTYTLLCTDSTTGSCTGIQRNGDLPPEKEKQGVPAAAPWVKNLTAGLGSLWRFGFSSWLGNFQNAACVTTGERKEGRREGGKKGRKREEGRRKVSRKAEGVLKYIQYIQNFGGVRGRVKLR